MPDTLPVRRAKARLAAGDYDHLAALDKAIDRMLAGPLAGCWDAIENAHATAAASEALATGIDVIDRPNIADVVADGQRKALVADVADAVRAVGLRVVSVSVPHPRGDDVTEGAEDDGELRARWDAAHCGDRFE